MTFFVLFLFPERNPQPPTFFTARSLKIEQGLPKNLVWKKTTWVLITVTYILKIFMTRYAPAKLALSPLSLFDTGMHERGL